MREEVGDALFFDAGNGRRFAFPEVTVVDEQGIRLLGDGGFNSCLRGGDGGGDAPDFRFAFDLDAVGCVVAVTATLQVVVEVGV